jgi:hypothetical protein
VVPNVPSVALVPVPTASMPWPTFTVTRVVTPSLGAEFEGKSAPVLYGQVIVHMRPEYLSLIRPNALSPLSTAFTV